MRVILVTLFCLLATGCNSDLRCRRETALLRAEYLDLEDKYYQLKSERDSVLSDLGGGPYYAESEIIYEGDVAYGDGLIYEGEVIFEGPAPSMETTVPANIADESSGSSSVVQRPIAEAPIVAPQSRGVESLNEFEIKLPETGPESVQELPEPNRDDGNPQSRLMLNSPESEISSIQSARTNSDITEVVINRKLTRGHDVDGIPGDEGIDLLVQPRTSDGQIEYRSGELTVSVIDPAESPARQRIGLWKFLPSETELFFANDDRGSRGILLHLPWDQSTPIHERLMIHVRFVTADGREFKTSTELQINPPAPGYSANDPLVMGWTLQDSRWISASTTSQGAQNADWRPRKSSNRDSMESSIGGPTAKPSIAQPFRRTTPAIPAKAEIEKPQWRPIR